MSMDYLVNEMHYSVRVSLIVAVSMLTNKAKNVSNAVISYVTWWYQIVRHFLRYKLANVISYVSRCNTLLKNNPF